MAQLTRCRRPAEPELLRDLRRRARAKRDQGDDPSARWVCEQVNSLAVALWHVGDMVPIDAYSTLIATLPARFRDADVPIAGDGAA